jgi:hypothetical protein
MFGTNLAPHLSAPRADTSRRAWKIMVSRREGALLRPARTGFRPPAVTARLDIQW